MDIIRNIFIVGFGGAMGTILRYLTAVYINRLLASAFPLATFTINLIGCLLIGILIGIADRQPWFNDTYKLLLITGFCGGYTTFSAFALENVNLVQNGNLLISLLYTAFSVLAGMAAVWLGMALVK